jgi:hypothetical protein
MYPAVLAHKRLNSIRIGEVFKSMRSKERAL